MSILSLLALAAFDTVLSIIEIPKMLNGKLYRELIVYSILLLAGTVITVMKIFDMTIPNPSDLLAWIYSPLAEPMKQMLKG